MLDNIMGGWMSGWFGQKHNINLTFCNVTWVWTALPKNESQIRLFSVLFGIIFVIAHQKVYTVVHCKID